MSEVRPINPCLPCGASFHSSCNCAGLVADCAKHCTFLTINGTNCALKPAQHANPQGLPRPATTKDWSIFKRKALGLTQVNRQLRHKFLAIVEDTHCADIDHYCLEHVFAGLEANDKTKAIARINVTIEFASTGIHDARPTMLLHATAPGLHVLHDSDALQQNALTLERDSTFYKYLRERVAGVYIHVGRRQSVRGTGTDLHKVVVLVKKEFREEWM
jgi:hypothetical protein